MDVADTIDLAPEAQGRLRAAQDIALAIETLLDLMDLGDRASAKAGVSLPPDDAAFLDAQRADLAWWERQAKARAKRLREGDL